MRIHWYAWTFWLAPVGLSFVLPAKGVAIVWLVALAVVVAVNVGPTRRRS